MTHWHIIHNDILDQRAEGLLCSANPSLNLSGGVGGAFGSRYGDEMQSYLHSHLAESAVRIVPPGGAVIAPPCGSPFLAVAHAVSIDVFYDTDSETILKTYDTAIRGLAEKGCHTIVAACLGCGYGRVPDSDFVALSTQLFQTCYETVTDVWLVTTNRELAAALSASLDVETD